jgi:long-chain acyl-CoA synthetase
VTERFDPIAHIERTFEEHANRVFLIEYPLSRQVTYGEFRQFALRAAAMLQAHGIGRGDRVAMILANSTEFAALYFACMFVGAVAVPVNQALHAREVHDILGAANAKLLLYSLCTRPLVLAAAAGMRFKQVRVLLAQEKVAHPEEDDAWSLESTPLGPLPKPFEGVGSDDLFVVLYTSGTASAPKGVAHRIFSEVANGHAFNVEMGFGHADRFLHIWPMAYSTGVLNTLLSPFLAGGSVVLGPAFGPKSLLTFWKPILQYRVNTLWLSPTMLAALLRVDRDAAGLAYCKESIKTVCVGTAPLPLRLKKDFEAKYGVELLESYGLSELLLITANTPRQARKESSVGRALEGVEVTLAEDGEIHVRTPFTMLGYLDETTSEPNRLDPASFFATGDVGRFDEDGNLYITGRKKDLIIRGGLNISPRAIQDVLVEHPAVAEAAVVGLAHEFLGEEIAALLQMQPGSTIAEQRPSILKWCRDRLNAAAVPTRLHSVKELPKGSTGKVLTREVREIVKGLAPDADEA